MLKERAKKKISIVSFICAALLTIISCKLSYLTLFEYQNLQNLATDLWERSFPLVAPRGIIVDANNKPVAINQPCMSIAVIPFQITEKESAARTIATIIGEKYETILSKISKKASIVRLHPEGRRINDQEVEALRQANLKGVYLVADNNRYYPYEEKIASLLGFVGVDNQGLAGIESFYDKYLMGVDGTLNYKMDAKGGLFPSTSSRVVAPVEGFTLKLTLDLRIQNILEREMANAWAKYNPEEIIGIAMDPNSGEILAIGNRPTYNNNHYQDYDNTIYNRTLPVFSSYEPGSTFKAVSFAAAINENLIDIDNDYYYDKGYEIIGGTRIKSWKKGGDGLQTFLEVLQNSSNPGFVEIARRLGKDKLYEYLTAFGVGTKTGVDIQGESTGIMFNYDNYGILEQATSAFGQGISTTAIQLASAFSATINGGYIYVPHVAKSFLHSGTKDVIYEYPTTIKRQVITQETSATMRRALECVVALGTGRRAYIDGYRVGGKTGTAQIAEKGVYLDGKYVLSFIAGAPMNDPKIVVYFAIRAPKNTIQYGGTTVGPIVKTILSESLPLLGVEKQPDGVERTYTWMDVKTHPVDNYIGLTKNKVRSPYFKFVFFGEGNTVIDQLPRVGEMIKEGGSIMIMLGG